MDRVKSLMIVRELVLREDPNNRVHCRGMNEPEQQAADAFEHAVDPFERKCQYETRYPGESGFAAYENQKDWVISFPLSCL